MQNLFNILQMYKNVIIQLNKRYTCTMFHGKIVDFEEIEAFKKNAILGGFLIIKLFFKFIDSVLV